MYRTKLIEFDLKTVTPITRHSAKPKEERIEHNGFTLVEKGKKVELVINTPGAIYSEDFISKLASLIQSKGDVKVNCGRDSEQAKFLAEELCSDDLHEKIFNQDQKEFTCSLRREIVRNGWFNFRWKEYISVIFKKAEASKNSNEVDLSWLNELQSDQLPNNANAYVVFGDQLNDIDINELPFAEPVTPGEGGAAYEIIIEGYGPWYEKLEQTINLLSCGKPVNIKRENLFSPENSFVLQV